MTLTVMYSAVWDSLVCMAHSALEIILNIEYTQNATHLGTVSALIIHNAQFSIGDRASLIPPPSDIEIQKSFVVRHT